MANISKQKKRLLWEWKSQSTSWSNDFSFYVTSDWRKMSAQVRQEEPFCKICKSKGITKLTEVADHIVSIKSGGSKLDRNNLQGLCRSCNNAKKT